MSNEICRFGILSTAEIGQKNWQAIRLAENATLTAVASRSVEKAQQFIDRCQSFVPFETVPTALGSYDELLRSPDVDAVYIPLPTGLRKEWVLKAAAAGKHVLCEKPCAIDHADLVEMTKACQENNVQFMDGVMFMHSERMTKLRQVIDANEVGDLRRICIQFSFCAPEEFKQGNIRASGELEPQGCVGDLGWYAIRMILWTMNYQMPTKVTGRLISDHQRSDSNSPVPMEFSSELFFEGGVSASFYCSFITEHQQWVHLSGTGGQLLLQDFVLPYTGSSLHFDVIKPAFEVVGCDFNMEKHEQRYSTPEYPNSWSNAQETNLVRNFSKLAIDGTDSHWPEISLKTQKIMDLVLESAKNESRPMDVS